MRRPRLSDNQRRLWLEELKTREILHQRRKRLYNRIYRKSPFFLTMWGIRLLYILLFFVIVFSDPISGGFRDEIVKNTQSNIYRIHTRRNGSYLKTRRDIQTDKSYYTAYFRRESPPIVCVGDTLQIERDIFNKSIYFTKKEWDIKYLISSYFDGILFFIHLLMVIFTIISFAFNDGLFKYNSKVLTFICTNIAIASSIYILDRLYYVIFG